MSKELSIPEQTRLSECEEIIKAGLQTFQEVGSALLTIRDNRLYREQAETFESYCQTRWGMSRRRANQLVEASKIAEDLGTIVPKPANEAQARPLSQLPPEKRQEAWDRAVEVSDGKPTAKIVAQVVEEMRPKTVKVSPALEAIGKRLVKNQFEGAGAHIQTADEEHDNQNQEPIEEEPENLGPIGPKTEDEPTKTPAPAAVDSDIETQVWMKWMEAVNTTRKVKMVAWALEVAIPQVTKILERNK